MLQKEKSIFKKHGYLLHINVYFFLLQIKQEVLKREEVK